MHKTAYLFEADFSDGTTYIQGDADQSIDTPGKNCFYDVLNRLHDVVAFHLVGEGHRYSVNLLDGHFEIDGLRFQAGQDQFEPVNGFTLIRYLRTREAITLNRETGEEVSHESDTDFIIGWQAKDEKGKNHQQVITIS
jgi:hypothetical protein